MDLHLYPTAFGRDCALREAARLAGVLFGHRHFTYPELLERLYRAEGVVQRLIETPAQNVFVHRSLARVLGQSPSPGLVSAHRDVLNELKGAGIEADAFARCVELVAPDVPPNVLGALHRLLRVFQGYQACLTQAGLVDHGDRDLAVLMTLRQHLAEGTRPPLLRHVRRIVLHDVYHLSLVHYAIVSLLMKLVEDGGVIQHFTDGVNVEAVTFAEFTWQRFVADESLASHVLPEFVKRHRQGGTLQALSERLFTSGPQEAPLDPDRALEVLAAPGRAREVEAIARQVRELLVNGISPEQIAIVVRNLDAYGELLESALRRYRIPAWFRRGIPLFHLPLVKTVFSVLELAGTTYPRKSLLKLMTSAYFRVEGEWPDDPVELVDRAGYLDRSHISLPRLLDESLRRHRPGDEETSRVKALRDWVEALQIALDELVADPRPFSAYLEAIKALLIQLGLFRVLGMQPDVPLYVIQRDRDGLRLTFETLRAGAEALRLLGDPVLEFPEFRLLAIDLLREGTLDQPSREHGAVRVLGVRDTLGLDFDYVFVPGLADTEFPQHYTEHPVLDDAARRAVNRAARIVLAERFAGVLERQLLSNALLTAAQSAREEPLLFFLALQSANQRCVLSYPTRTSEGETLFPSMFVNEVLRHFRDAEAGDAVVTRIPALPSVPLPSHCLEPGELLRQAALAWRTTGPAGQDTGTANPSWLDAALRSQGVAVDRLRQLAAREVARKRYLLEAAPSAALDGSPFGAIGQRIDLRGRFLDPQHPWSPTMLEEAAACGFRFFANRLLRLAPRTEPDYDTSPLVLGELAHAILAEFFQSDPPRDRGAAVEQMRRLAEQRLANHPRRASLGHPGFWHVRRAELLAVLADVAAYVAEGQGDAYRTHYLEHEMGGAAAYGAWSISLTGRVDRVAIREEGSGVSGILLQDFKYSSASDRYRELLKPEALGRSSFQLPLYLFLTIQQLERDGHPVQADAELLLEYLLLKDPERKAQGLRVTRELFEIDRPNALFDGIRRVTDQAMAGRFVPRPADGKQTCAYCAYAGLCRYWTSGAGAEAWAHRDTLDEGDTLVG